MDRGHIVFVSFPHPPHVNPTIPIVAVLVRRGYRVSYVTSERFRDRLVSVGASVITSAPFNTEVDHYFNAPGGGRVETLVDRFFELADATERATLPILERDRPDVLVHDVGAYAGNILGKRLRVPLVATDPTFALDLQRLDSQMTHAKFREETIEIVRACTHHLKQRQLWNNGPLDGGGLRIQLHPRALQPDGDVFGAEYLYAGRCPGEQPLYGHWQDSCSCGRPIVLVSSSTTSLRRSDYYRMCIEALKGLGWHVVLSIGDHGDADSLSPLPPHFEVVQKVSHLAILRYASLMICMGGNMTVSEALYHGVPLIVMSYGHPELEWQADNIAEKGCGIHLQIQNTDFLRLRRAVAQISSDMRFLMRTRRLMWEIRREPGSEEVANRIEDFAHI